mgnify:CR=1 FL=1
MQLILLAPLQLLAYMVYTVLYHCGRELASYRFVLEFFCFLTLCSARISRGGNFATVSRYRRTIFNLSIFGSRHAFFTVCFCLLSGVKFVLQ